MFLEAGGWNREALGLIPWVLLSWVVFWGGAVFHGVIRRWGRGGRRAVEWLEGAAALLAPGQALGFLYAVVPPYAALVLGFLDPQLTGLVEVSWWRALGRGSLLAGGLWLLAVLVWQAYLRAGPPPAGLLFRQRRWAASPAGRLLFLLSAAAEEVHWALYRALPILLWGGSVGVWVGLLLIAAERYADPRTTGRLRQPGGVEEEAWWLTKLLAMTAAFAVLWNLWVCILIHAVLEGVAAAMVRRRVPAGLAEEMPPAPAAPMLPALLSAVGSLMLLWVLLAWGAVRPQALPPGSVAAAVPPPSVIVPTPTCTRTPLPTTLPTATVTPTPLPTATPTPTPPLTYVVQPGDTLGQIAVMYGVSVEDLMRLNGVTDPTRLQIGQVLQIP